MAINKRVKLVTLAYAHRTDNMHNLWQKLHHMLLFEYQNELDASDSRLEGFT